MIVVRNVGFIKGKIMEITCKPEDLRKCKLFVATPMFGGMNHGLFMKSCLDLQNLMQQWGIEIKFSFIFNESLITRARAYLVDEFLYRSDSTHLLFIDADIAFNPQDILALLALDKEVIGAPYPKKSIKWANIKKAVLKSHNAIISREDENRNRVLNGLEPLPEVKEIEDGELAKLGGDYVFNAVQGTQRFSVSEPLEVLEIGTGFMLVKREVFSKFKEAFPDLRYKPDHVGQKNFDGSRYIHMFFECYIDRGEGTGNTERYLSEDYGFCQRWRMIGGHIWLCPWMLTSHCGTHMFEGNMPAIAGHLGEI